jgi:hypothetical protein
MHSFAACAYGQSSAGSFAVCSMHSFAACGYGQPSAGSFAVCSMHSFAVLRLRATERR